MLRASLRQIVADPEQLLADCGINPQWRAEQLGVADFCRIASMLSKRSAI
jgi:16S rRNA A1518/A1519 N6-dimethyltransferase RsmA/KsgA/DIM1 with predicted DNA glycosylase/AP lyase activity